MLSENGSRGTPSEADVSLGLKEWEPVIRAVRDGRQVILVKSGGLLDYGGFPLPSAGSPYFVLYPAYYHNTGSSLKDRALRNPAARRASTSASTDFVVSISDVFEYSSAKDAEALSPHHVWSEEYVRSKFEWGDNKVVKVLCVRSHLLDRPVPIPPKNTGCRSWVDFDRPIQVRIAAPVLQDEEYLRRVSDVARILGPLSRVPLTGHGASAL